ncbi:MAG: endonuclease III [Candidatus Thermoplasmatota archaeon]|nr:endonuclease III [Candidatus Thermoplasmatota archaeon]
MASCTDRQLGRRHLEQLERYERYWWNEEDEDDYHMAMSRPFSALIFTLLSQNTSSANTRRAYRGLRTAFDVTPAALLAADEATLATAIRPGGLHHVKAGRIKELAAFVLDEYDGDLGWTYDLPRETVRRRLLAMPGIGPKTADVLLSHIHGQREAFVVDTHMFRIAFRLGLVEHGTSYARVQRCLTAFFPWDAIPSGQRDRVVQLFWFLARHTCSARNPRCPECPLADICEQRLE